MTLKRAPLNRTRSTPRRDKHPIDMPGAMKQGRTKERHTGPMRAVHKRHADRLAQKGCLVCKRPAEIHHETTVTGLRDNRFLAPLCEFHHRIGPNSKTSREALGVDGFKEEYGIDLKAFAIAQWAVTLRLEEERKL